MSLIHTPGNEPPQGLVSGYFPTSDGLNLRFAMSRIAKARGTVVVLQGRGDFLERYFETFRDLNALGFSAASFDFRGQGGSPRLQKDAFRSNVPDFKLYDDDLASFLSAGPFDGRLCWLARFAKAQLVFARCSHLAHARCEYWAMAQALGAVCGDFIGTVWLWRFSGTGKACPTFGAA